MENDIKFAIIIPVYQRADGKSFELVSRAIESILNQTYKNFKIYLIGDKYDDDIEFNRIVQQVPSDKIFSRNLEFAMERERYSGFELWNVGGVNASNLAFNVIKEDLLDWVCFLDYDDYYLMNHLEVMNDAIHKTGYKLISTITLIETGTNKERFIPYKIGDNMNYFNEFLPEPANLAKTSVCINHRYFEYIKFRNTIEECGYIYPGDADMWNRLKSFLEEKKQTGILVNVHTCCNGIGGSIMNIN